MEKIFLYNNTRCHAKVLKERLGGETYIGTLDGYEIYEIDPHSLFDQFGFIAIPENGNKERTKT